MLIWSLQRYYVNVFVRWKLKPFVSHTEASKRNYIEDWMVNGRAWLLRSWFGGSIVSVNTLKEEINQRQISWSLRNDYWPRVEDCCQSWPCYDIRSSKMAILKIDVAWATMGCLTANLWRIEPHDAIEEVLKSLRLRSGVGGLDTSMDYRKMSRFMPVSP